MRPAAVALAVGLVLSAGGRDAAGRGSPSSPRQPRESVAAMLAALTAYEDVRARLAEDRTDGVREAAERVRAESRRAGSSAPASLRPLLDALRQAAAELARKAAARDPIDDLRWAFGELSRAAIALVHAEPSLAEGRFVFECAAVTRSYDRAS